MKLTHVDRGDAFVRLAPLSSSLVPPLAALADSHPSLFRHWPRDLTAGYAEEAQWLLTEQQAGRWIAHVVHDGQGRVVGQTCYLALQPDHAGVEIGGTWYAPEAQGGSINPAAKRLMLGHAFACGAERVALKTDARNTRSMAAIQKMGAQFEGVFRRHMRRPDGTWRDTAWFSVTRNDWPMVQAGLDTRLAGFARQRR